MKITRRLFLSLAAAGVALTNIVFDAKDEAQLPDPPAKGEEKPDEMLQFMAIGLAEKPRLSTVRLMRGKTLLIKCQVSSAGTMFHSPARSSPILSPPGYPPFRLVCHDPSVQLMMVFRRNGARYASHREANSREWITVAMDAPRHV